MFLNKRPFCSTTQQPSPQKNSIFTLQLFFCESKEIMRKSSVPLLVNNDKVYVACSEIENAGLGLFANQNIEKGEIVCSYGGKILDSQEALYENPTNMIQLELCKGGYSLLGDCEEGDLGLFANSVMKGCSVRKNAKYCIDRYSGRFTKAVADKCMGITPVRFRFIMVASTNIKKGSEIIMDYGVGYWSNISRWKKNGVLKKETSIVAREERMAKRKKLH